MPKPFVSVVIANPWNTIMVDARVLKTARLVAIGHIGVGILLVLFGIVDRVEGYFWTGDGCFGIWCGVWTIITGCLGIPGSNRERNSQSQSFAGAFMGCAIASAVFGGIIIICYSISIAVYRDDYWWRSNYESYLYNHDAEMAIAAIILVLGIVEFGIGIWAAILSCFMNPCQCCASQPDQATPMVYMSNQGMVYSAGGVPMGIPMQATGGVAMVPVSSSGAVGVHPQTVQVPSGGFMQVAGQPQMYQVPSAGAMVVQPQMVQVPTSGALGGQAHMVQVPTSGALGGQAHMVQVPTSGALGGQAHMVQAPTSVSLGGQAHMVEMPTTGSLGGQAHMVQMPISGALGGQAHMVHGPTSGALGGQAQMVQVPLTGGPGIQDQMVQVPKSGSEEGQPRFVRVTPDGPVSGDKELLS